tara:strand:- start:408 stop:1115 length:708 start_codon:yes stop_codon:yes gene_type:complete
MQNIVLCPGLPRSGTTSLSRLIPNITHKEPQYLFGLYDFNSCYPELYPEEVVDTHTKFILDQNKQELNLDVPYSFDDYSSYISEYKYDFSQSTWLLTEQQLTEIKNSLSQFNIKIILMFREPVSRLWSYCNMICEDWNTNNSPKQLFDEYVTKCDIYVDIFDKFNNVFDEVLCLSTEKFFGSQEECDKLTDFLEIDRIVMTNEFSNSIDYDTLDESELQTYQGLLKKSYNFHKSL